MSLCWTIRDSRASGTLRQAEKFTCAQAFCCSCSFVAGDWALVKRGAHILFNESCLVFLKETEAKVTRRKAAALRLELAFGLESQLYTAFFYFFS